MVSSTLVASCLALLAAPVRGFVARTTIVSRAPGAQVRYYYRQYCVVLDSHTSTCLVPLSIVFVVPPVFGGVAARTLRRKRLCRFVICMLCRRWRFDKPRFIGSLSKEHAPLTPPVISCYYCCCAICCICGCPQTPFRTDSQDDSIDSYNSHSWSGGIFHACGYLRCCLLPLCVWKPRRSEATMRCLSWPSGSNQ